MKKNKELSWDEKFPGFEKLFRIMKLTTFLVLISIVSAFANKTFSQSKMLNLNMEKVTVREVLSKIEDQSEFHFMYSGKVVDVTRLVSIKVQDAKINEVLKSLFSGTEVDYTIKDKLILLTIPESNSTTFQQQKSISGKVTDSSGGPLPGVSVAVKGTTNGTITDADGNYKLSNVPANATLQFSFVGMKTQEEIVAGKATINMVLSEETIGIEEVVAVGYGVQKKVNLTGSVSSVSSNSLAQRATTNPTSLLEGRLSGLQVTQSSGQPGRDDASFQIRGLGSFGASSSPLVLIDGIAGSLSSLAPNDIETVTVLKDAASASIYGSRAANGVILITTKQAKKGRSVEYQFDIGVHTPTRMPELITNSAEYMGMYNAARTRSGMTPLYTQDQIDAYKNATDKEEYPNFDWLDYYFNPATVTNHYLSFSNATDNGSYKFSLNYLDQPGILSFTKYKKYNAQLNFTNQISKSIKIGTNINAVFGDIKEPSNWKASDALRYIYSQAPLYKPFLPDGSGRKTAWAYPNEPHNSNAPVAFENGERLTKNYGINAQAYMDVNLFKGLVWTIKASVNYSDNTMKDHAYATLDHYYYHKVPGNTDYTLASSVTSVYTGTGLTDTYTKTILPSIYSVINYETQIGKDHNIRAMVGYEQQSSKSQYLSGNKKVFPTSSLTELDAGSSSGQSVGGSTYEWALRSYFGRIGYDYKGKYLIEANTRYDGTSRVAKANRWGFFPSLSAGWRLSEENMIKDRFSWMSNLKLRASYGVLGNQEIGNYPYQDILSLTSYPFNGKTEQGAVVTRFTDKDLRWELTKVFDVGLDLDVKNGLFGMTFDWFKKKTSDILTTLPVPASLGLSGPVTNNGEMQNTGCDIELRHGKQIGEFRYDVNVVVSTFKNKLLSIVTPSKGVNEVGLPFNSFYMYEMEGIFQSQEDINNSPKQPYYPSKPGDIKIKDQDGNKIIDSNDRISISPYPDFTYSFGLNVGWRRFSFSAFFQGVKGLRTKISGWGFDPFNEGDTPSVRFRNAWSTTNPSNSIPAIYLGSGYQGVYAYPSTYNLPDASYLRLKNVNLSYDLPKQVISKLRLQDLIVYVSGDNLFTFTKFPGVDPELPSTGLAAAYPQVRILNMGVKVKF